MAKRPIDMQRESAVGMTIVDESDDSPISQVLSLPDELLLIKGRGIWRFQLADDIDPDRTNPKVPNAQQKLLGRGAADELVCRTLLQAHLLLSTGFSRTESLYGAALASTFDFLRDLDALQNGIDDLREKLSSAERDFDSNKLKTGLQLPALRDVAARGKGLKQALDHLVRKLWVFVRAFRPELPPGVSWSKFREQAMARGQTEASLASLVLKLQEGFSSIRNSRNAIEHPRPGHEVILHDYRLKPDGLVHRPTIEVIHSETPVDESELLMFAESMSKYILEAYELLLVHLCGLHAKSRGVFELRIAMLPAERRSNVHVKFSFFTKLHEQWVPLG